MAIKVFENKQTALVSWRMGNDNISKRVRKKSGKFGTRKPKKDMEQHRRRWLILLEDGRKGGTRQKMEESLQTAGWIWLQNQFESITRPSFYSKWVMKICLLRFLKKLLDCLN